MYLLGFLLGELHLPLHVSKCSAASAYLSHNQRFSVQYPKHPFHCHLEATMKVNTRCNFITSVLEGTSTCDQSRGPHPPSEMPRGCSMRLVPRNQGGLNFVRHVPATCTRVKSLRVNCSWDQSSQSDENRPQDFLCLQNIASTWCSLECYLVLTD